MWECGSNSEPKYQVFFISKILFRVIKYRFIVVLISMLSLSTGVCAQQDMSAKAALQQDKMLIGDQLQLTFDLEYPKNAVLQHIDFEQLDTNSIELIEYTLMDSLELPHYKKNTIQTIVTAFTAGDYKLSVPIRILTGQRVDTIFSDTIRLTVYSPKLDSMALAPIKDIFPESDNISDWWWLIALLLFVALVLWRIFGRRKTTIKPLFSKPTITVSPYETAIAALERLQKSDMLARDNTKGYYSELSMIIRLFLEQAYQIPAMELTTNQVLANHDTRNLASEQQDYLRKLLNTADLVKFAKVNPNATTHQDAWHNAMQVVLLSKNK